MNDKLDRLRGYIDAQRLLAAQLKVEERLLASRFDAVASDHIDSVAG